MPDRTTSPSASSPEELLDQWLDALNASGQSAPPIPPEAIAEIAKVALEYRRALGPAPTIAASQPVQSERNGSMYHTLPLATPNGRTWTAAERSEQTRHSWVGGFSSWLATAVIAGLLIALVGGAFIRLNNLPGGSGDPTRAPGAAVSQGATPAETSLSCGSPGYHPVISDGVADAELDRIGLRDPIVETGDGVTVPLADGGTRMLPPDSNIVPESDVALAVHDDNSATVTRISTGETWEYSAVEPRVQGQHHDYFTNGRYVVGPADDGRTDWLITDTLTGATRTTADILGEPFEGPLDLWMQRSSENDRLWVLHFTQISFPGHDETPTAERIDTPGYLFIPGSLDDAWFGPEWQDEIVASPDGTSFIAAQVVRNPLTGDRIDAGEDGLTYSGELIGYLDDSTLLTYRGDTVNTVDIHTGETTAIYTAASGIVSVAWAPDAARLAIGSGTRGPVTWVLLDLASGEAMSLPDLDGYQLANVSMTGAVARTAGAAAFIQPASDDRAEIDVRALDMDTGSVSPPVTTRTRARDAGLPSLPATTDGRFVETSNSEGDLVFIDPTSGEIIELPVPDGVEPPEGGQLSIVVVPSGKCALLNILDEQGQVFGLSWIAPLETGAEWTQLPFELRNWIEIPTDTTQTLSAQDFGTPAATPESG